MSGANKDWSSLHFLGPVSSWESYTAMIFLLTLLAQDYAQAKRSKWEKEEGETCISLSGLW